MARAVLAAVQDDDAVFAPLDRLLLDCLDDPPDSTAVAERLRGRRFWLADPAVPPLDPDWPLADAPTVTTVAEVRARLSGWPEAQVDRLIDLATAHVRFTHRGCDVAYGHMALNYFVGVWILDHVIDDTLHNRGFGSATPHVLEAMMEGRSDLLPGDVVCREALECGLDLVARCRDRLPDVLTEEGARASWLELRKWFAQVAPVGDRSATAAAQEDPGRFVQYRTLNSGMPWVLLTVWYRRTQSTAIQPPPTVAAALRCLAFVTAIYNDLVSVPEDGGTRACNAVYMLLESGRCETLGQAFDATVAWYNAGLAVLVDLLQEAGDPVLDDLCDGFVAGMAVWQNVEPKYAVGARELRELREHGVRRAVARPRPVRAREPAERTGRAARPASGKFLARQCPNPPLES